MGVCGGRFFLAPKRGCASTRLLLAAVRAQNRGPLACREDLIADRR